jgi:hypothetical protein
MRIFEVDDTGYLAWIERNQHGFVIHTTRKPDLRYLYLHRASCGTIRGKPARGERWTTDELIKVCAEGCAELDQRARQSAGGELHPCGLCRPD